MPSCEWNIRLAVKIDTVFKQQFLPTCNIVQKDVKLPPVYESQKDLLRSFALFFIITQNKSPNGNIDWSWTLPWEHQNHLDSH